jgi:hypothetical protein
LAANIETITVNTCNISNAVIDESTITFANIGNLELNGNTILGSNDVIYFDLFNYDENGYIMTSETFKPRTSGQYTLGTSNAKWKDVYSASSSGISSSDRNLKENIVPIQDKYETMFSYLSPVSYTFKDGTSGRTHIGFISQDVEEAMTKSNLTSLDFAGFCKDIKTKTAINVDGKEIVELDLDESGNKQYDYSLRYGEFTALNTHMIQKTIKELNKTKLQLADLRTKYDKLAEFVGFKE